MRRSSRPAVHRTGLHARRSRGITLVEVSLAIVVVTILSLTVFSGIVAAQRVLTDGILNKVARDVAMGAVEQLERDGVPDPVVDPFDTVVIDDRTYTVHVTAALEGTTGEDYYVVTVTVDRPDGETYEIDTIVGADK